MNKKIKVTLALITVMIFSFAISSNMITKATFFHDFTYSDKLVPGAELAWKLTKFESTPEETNGAYIPLLEGVNMTEGDVFKIVILQDLDDLNLDFMDELYFTSQQWGEFFLNDVSLSKNATDLYWYTFYGTSGFLMSSLIVPTTVQIYTETKNYFDFLTEDFESLAGNETEGITIKNTADTYTMKYKIHISLTFLISLSLDMSLEIGYNKEWGVLAKYDLSETIKSGGETTKIRMLYESVTDEIKVPFNWMFSFIAIFVTAIVILRRRRKI